MIALLSKLEVDTSSCLVSLRRARRVFVCDCLDLPGQASAYTLHFVTDFSLHFKPQTNWRGRWLLEVQTLNVEDPWNGSRSDAQNSPCSEHLWMVRWRALTYAAVGRCLAWNMR